MKCSECKANTAPILSDESFSFEHGSQRGTHKIVEVLSECCQMPIVMDNGSMMVESDFKLYTEMEKL